MTSNSRPLTQVVSGQRRGKCSTSPPRKQSMWTSHRRNALMSQGTWKPWLSAIPIRASVMRSLSCSGGCERPPDHNLTDHRTQDSHLSPTHRSHCVARSPPTVPEQFWTESGFGLEKSTQWNVTASHRRRQTSLSTGSRSVKITTLRACHSTRPSLCCKLPIPYPAPYRHSQHRNCHPQTGDQFRLCPTGPHLRPVSLA